MAAEPSERRLRAEPSRGMAESERRTAANVQSAEKAAEKSVEIWPSGGYVTAERQIAAEQTRPGDSRPSVE